MKHFLGIFGLIFITLGCASAEKKLERKGESARYTKAVLGVDPQTVTGAVCQFDEKKDKNISWNTLVDRAGFCVRKSDWKTLDLIAEQLSEREPLAPWGSYFHSVAAEKQGAPDRALWMIELSLKKANNVGVLHYQRGRLIWARENHEGAIESFLTAVSLDPNLIEAHRFLGQIYFRDQEFNLAARHFHRVLAGSARDKVALSGLAECRLQAGDPRGAVEYLKLAVAAYPNQMSFRLREANVLESYLQDRQGALSAYLEARRLGRQQGRATELAGINSKIKELEMLSGGRAPASQGGMK